MKEAPVPALSNDNIPGCSNGRAVWWNLDSYKVIDGSMRLDDGRCVADMAIGEIAVLAEDAAIIERCAFRGDRKERLSKMGQKDDRREVMGLAGVSVSKADARGDDYVVKHARQYKEDVVTSMEVMGMIPSAPKAEKEVWYMHNGQNYVVRMASRAEFNYYLRNVPGVQPWCPQSTHLWQRVLRCENGDEIGVESVAELSMVLLGNVDNEDWDSFQVECALLELNLTKSQIGV